MPLLAFLASNPDEIAKATIEQIVAMAGDGVLRDNSQCCDELRKYLNEAETEKLETYIDRCLSSGFTNSGFVFQDLVNELGRRLDYQVLNGLYRGTQKAIGFDGTWTSPEGQRIVVETKTTDAYTVKLETIAKYRDKLLAAHEIKHPCSVLLVVGRQETGELEAQIRGSRHAWDIRVISAESLLKLVHLKESSDEPETGLKIRSLLTPMEFTRLDNLVDVMFATATDLETGVVEAVTETSAAIPTGASATTSVSSGWEFTDIDVLDAKRNEIIEAMSRQIGAKLIKKSRALYWDALHKRRIACSISKRYTRGAYDYWYAYHPEWDSFLAEADDAYFVLGCMDLPDAFAIPFKTIRQYRDQLNTTTTSKGKTYWHVHLTEADQGIGLVLPGVGVVPLTDFKVHI